MLEILVRYLHFLCVFTIVATLAGEYILLKKSLNRSEIRRIMILDQLYGLAAVLLLGAGFTLWMLVGSKPAQFYTYNAIFWVKLSLFTTVGLFSIYPTIFFAKEGKKGLPEAEIEIPTLVRNLVKWELILLIFIPLCASLMARGIGYFG
ncbi:MAG: DUF2214 family protein [Microscillaceae bacterium]|nr:DUF2214 family protein [Microscillaceae bacterium]